jgi:hypothetical protein
MKQTAVDWLIEELDKIYHIKEKFLPSDWEFLEETSKEIEKEQIGRAYQGGLIDGMTHSPRDYYNETFNTNEK